MTETTHELPPPDPAGFDRPTAAAGAFPVAAWFTARAAADRLSLQPLKLQALLFLAQGVFAARTGGRLLMPAAFVADERAPIEPNIHAVLATGWDPHEAGDGTLGTPVERFLDVIWEQFGRHSAPDLVTLVTGTDAYVSALACGAGTPIANDAMRRSCSVHAMLHSEKAASATEPMRTQHGRLVTVSPWNPNAKPAASPSAAKARR